MAREEMIAALVAAGQDQAQLDTMSDADLKALMDQLGMGAAPAAGAAPPPAGVAAMADVPREQMIAELVELGEDAAELEAMTEEDLKTLYDLLKGGDEGDAAAAGAAASPSPAATPMSERVAKYAEQTMARLTAVNRQLATQANQMKRQKIAAFCERMVNQGRILPAQKGDYVSLLMGLTEGVRKFSDNRPRASELAEKMAEIAKRAPLIRLSERVASDPRKGGDANSEVRKVEKFAELQGPTLRKYGTDPKTMVDAAKKRAAEDPDFSAAEIIGRDGVAMVS